MTAFIKKHKFDIILISAILLAIAVCLIYFSVTRTEGAYAVVTVDGKETSSYSLNTDTVVKLENEGGYNILVIKDGKAFIEEASCPDKLCVNQHEIKFNGETLVCLPNKTTVKIVSEVEPEADFLS